MLIYHFDHRGVFAGSSEADPSPLEPGKFIIPARATTLAPPVLPDDQVAKWNGAEWVASTVRPPEPEADAVAKLAQFLSLNPDVASLIDLGSNPAGNAPEE